MNIPTEEAGIASRLAELTWEQVTAALFLDVVVAISYVLLLYIIVCVSREKKFTLYLPRQVYFKAFLLVIVLNIGSSAAGLFASGATFGHGYKFLVAAVVLFTVWAVNRVLPAPAEKRTFRSPPKEATTPEPQAKAEPVPVSKPSKLDCAHAERDAAEAKLRDLEASIEQQVRNRTDELHRSNRALKKEAAENQAAAVRANLAKKQLDDLLRKTSTATILLDPGGIVIDASGALVSLLGYPSKAHILQHRLSDLLGPDTGPALRQLIATTLEHGSCSDIVVAGLPSGEPIPIEITAVAAGTSDAPRAAALIRDVAGSKVSKRELQKSREALTTAREVARKADSARSIFMAKMNHELRTPLNGIIGLADVLRHKAMENRLVAAEVLRMTDNIQQSGTLLLSLVNDLLDLSRLEAGKRTLAPIRLDVLHEIEAATLTLAAIAEMKQIRIVIQCDDTLEWTVDQRALKQIIINLVNNAIKFSPAHSRVFITVTHGTEVMRLTVSDEGPGVSPDDRERILKPFGRGEAAATQKADGVGLGLAIVSELLKLQNGSLEDQQCRSGWGDVYGDLSGRRARPAGERRSGNRR